MRISRYPALTVAVLLGIAVLIPAAVSAADHDHHHHHHHHGAADLAELQLNNGQPWQTDAPLRRGMAAIRDDVAAMLPEIHHDRLPPDGYAELAERLVEHIEYIFENCALPRDADDQLHIVLLQIADGLHAMRSGEDARAGAVAAVHALDAYGEHFDHPGWQSLRH